MNIIDINNTDDSLIKERVGNKDPFIVPDGYFEGLTGQIMAQLPAKPSVKSVPLRRSNTKMQWVAAAAVVGVVALGAYTYNNWQVTGAIESQEIAYSDDDIDEALDYVMMSNNDIATYLTMGE